MFEEKSDAHARVEHVHIFKGIVVERHPGNVFVLICCVTPQVFSINVCCVAVEKQEEEFRESLYGKHLLSQKKNLGVV